MLHKNVNFCFLVLYVLFLGSCKENKKTEVLPPPGVLCVKTAMKDTTEKYEQIGQIVAENSVKLVARVEGYLIKQNFVEGSLVKEGDIIFEIDPRQYQASIKEAEGNLKVAQAKLANAKIDFERYSLLVKDNAAAQKDLDAATMQKETAEGEVLRCEGELELAMLNLEYTKITAPFDGKIGVCPVNVGNLVGPVINTDLATIVSIDPVKVEFSVPEHIVIKIQNSFGSFDAASEAIEPELILSDGSLYPEKGKIYFANNVIDSSTGTMLFRAHFANPKGLLVPGAYVKILFKTKQTKKRILIPQNAIQRDQTGNFVMVVGKYNKVERRQIKIGQQDIENMSVQVLEGLSEGELIVVEGLLKIRPGMIVAPSLIQENSMPDEGHASEIKANTDKK